MTKISTRDSSTLPKEQSFLIQKTSSQEVNFFQEHLATTDEYINLFRRKDILPKISEQEFLETLYALASLDENIKLLISDWQEKMSDFHFNSKIKKKNPSNQLPTSNFDGSVVAKLFKEIHTIKRHCNIRHKTMKDFYSHIKKVNKFIGGYNGS